MHLHNAEPKDLLVNIYFINIESHTFCIYMVSTDRKKGFTSYHDFDDGDLAKSALIVPGT